MNKDLLLALASISSDLFIVKPVLRIVYTPQPLDIAV
jgi:hypothetical protein